MIIIVAFVPLDRVDEIVDAPVTELPQELHDLLNWFEDTYTGHPNGRGNGRQTP